jgi:hypothetical protein
MQRKFRQDLERMQRQSPPAVLPLVPLRGTFRIRMKRIRKWQFELKIGTFSPEIEV